MSPDAMLMRISLVIALVIGALSISKKMMSGDATFANKCGYIARCIVGDTPAQFFETRTWKNEKGQISAASIVDRLTKERNERLNSALGTVYATR